MTDEIRQLLKYISPNELAEIVRRAFIKWARTRKSKG